MTLIKPKQTLSALNIKGFPINGKPFNTSSIVEDKTKKMAGENQQRRLFSAIGLVVSLSLVLLAFEWKTYDKHEIMNLGQLEAQFEELQDIPITIQAPPPPPKMSTLTIFEAPDEVELAEEIEVILDIEVTEETVIEEIVFDQVPGEEVSDEIFEIVEESATPQDGLESFYRYVSKSLIYPVPAKQGEIQGKVFLQFVVNKDGTVGQVKVAKGLGFGCDEEAIRVIKEGPNWNPAKQRGFPVNSWVTLPLIFKLS